MRGYLPALNTVARLVERIGTMEQCTAHHREDRLLGSCSRACLPSHQAAGDEPGGADSAAWPHRPDQLRCPPGPPRPDDHELRMAYYLAAAAIVDRWETQE